LWKVPDESSFQNYQVKVASKVLKGHRSVVNQVSFHSLSSSLFRMLCLYKVDLYHSTPIGLFQVRYNDEYNLLVSSGVEKIVKVIILLYFNSTALCLLSSHHILLLSHRADV